MKRLSRLELAWLDRLAKRKFAKLARKRWQSSSRKRSVARRHARLRREGRWGTPIFAPERFVLNDPISRSHILEFLAEIRARVTQGEHVYLNFAKTQRMFADGTLLFVAELNRLYRYLGERPIIRCNYPRDKIVEQVLQQVGVFDMIGKPCRENVDDLDASVKFWKYATGTKAIGELFEPVLENYEGIIEKRLEQSMYKGVTEAMTNSSNHAYIDTRPDGLSLKGVEPRWWMFSQERDGSLIVALCDLGVGIPASLPKTRMKDWTSDSIRAFLTGIVTQGQISTDCVMIKAAIEIGRTRTDLPYRGRGLQQLKDVIDVAGSGHLTIHSNKGCYQYDPSKRSIEIINDYRDSVLGTLILWNVPITSVNQSETHDHH